MTGKKKKKKEWYTERNKKKGRENGDSESRGSL